LSRSQDTENVALALALPELNQSAIPEQFAHSGISALQLFSILRAYWKQSLIIAVSTISLSAVAIKLLPKTYTAEATLIVNTETKDPLAGRDFPVEMLSNYVATQIELIMSPIVLRPVMDRLKLTEDKAFTKGFKGNSEALRDFVEKKLSYNIAIDRGNGGQLLYLWSAARSPNQAADIANAIIDVYIEQDRQRLNSPAGERAQRYSEELAELREKVAAAQDKVTAYRQQKGISDLTGNSTGTEIQTLDNLQQRLLEAQNLRRSLEAKETGQQDSSDEATASTDVKSLRSVLNTQLTELAQLSTTYGPQHPKIKELNSQIAVTRQAIANETRSISDNTSTELARTRSLENKYLRAVADQQAKVLNLRQAQDEGSKLILELESAKSVYKQALDGFDQIMFQAVANHTNVNVVSRAIPPIRPSHPDKIKLMMMGIAAGLGLAVAIPLAYGLFLKRRVRCRDDLEREFGIAVLAQFEFVPELSRVP
jgi:succinoglycan biosynthesis transport protein ExoP